MKFFVVFVIFFAGCASNVYMNEGQRLEREGKLEEALQSFEKAAVIARNDLIPREDARLELLKKRFSYTNQFNALSRLAINSGDLIEAEKQVARSLVLDPANERAQTLRIEIARNVVMEQNIVCLPERIVLHIIQLDPLFITVL